MSTDVVVSVGVPSLVVLVGILINNSRLSGLNSNVNSRFEALTRVMEARFQTQGEKLYRVEQVIDARLKHLEERIR